VVVLAAAHGTRMGSPLPKVLHPVCGRPMVRWRVRAALDAGAHRVVVVGGPDGALAGTLPEGVALAIQPEARGTGDAVRCAAAHLERDRPVVVLAGDVPLITASAIAGLVRNHRESGSAATMLTTLLEDPTGHGRVVRDERGDVLRVVETKAPGDCTLNELAIREVNTGVLCFDGGALLDVLDRLRTENAQGEVYLPEALPLLRAAGRRVAAHLEAGVTVVDPARTVIDADVRIGAGTVIEPGCRLGGATTLGRGPRCTLRDAQVGDGAVLAARFTPAAAR
jgi:bifunctional UDP-N-acetylglucosamine pyrophosphorylase/glucosamine-1-phosphate N-acetyltransferase